MKNRFLAGLGAGHAVAMGLVRPNRALNGREGQLSLLVLKFGGTSVADVDRIRNVARPCEARGRGRSRLRRRGLGHGRPDQPARGLGRGGLGLQAERRERQRGFSAIYDAREYDAVVASGEQVTSGLLAIVLQSIGVNARSWQGWQIPMTTDGAHRAARITGVAVETLKPAHDGRRSGGGGRIPGHRPGEPHLDARAAAAPTRAPWPWLPRSTPTAATSIPTSTGSTPPTRHRAESPSA